MKTEKAKSLPAAVLREELYEILPCVIDTVGIQAAMLVNATYRNHGTHAEAIAVTDGNIKLQNSLEFFTRPSN